MDLTKKNTNNQKQFNLDFEKNDLNLNKNKNNKSDNKSDNKQPIKIKILPHQQTVENIMINIKDLIFTIIDMLENKENPLPFILSDDNNIFSCSLFLIIFGSLMLLLSSLLKSK